jgi:hypothetical protein
MIKKTIALASCYALLSACSSVDSTKVFNQQQAAILLHQGRTTQPTQQMMKVPLPDKREWKRVDMSLGTIGTPIMLIPANETATNWNQSIRTKILPYISDKDATAHKFVRNEIFNTKSDCKIAEATILSQTDESVFYSIRMSSCNDERNQTRIGKAITGNDAVYSVYYSAITGQVSDKQINRYSQVIKTAQLVHDPRYGVVR